MKKIKLYEIFKSDTIRNRYSAISITRVISRIPQNEAVRIDFENIFFASRSFCHELLRNTNKRENVVFENVAPAVQEMLDVAPIKPKFSLNYRTERISL